MLDQAGWTTRRIAEALFGDERFKDRVWRVLEPHRRRRAHMHAFLAMTAEQQERELAVLEQQALELLESPASSSDD